MKIRTDFVTNSSSSSFVILSKVNLTPELITHMKDEYGKYGERLLKDYLVDGKDVPRLAKDSYYCNSYLEGKEIDPNGKYLFSEHIWYTTEGDDSGDDAWLREHIPSENIEDVFKTEAD